ncbi:acetyltransferase [Aurantiacibacter atlanticus]|uniref:Acetyltransferase n=1 Tax=Aurantiacibacter atlanticus TaxID=1648404 RepID=A0A0H4V9X4_9SPHN|nr:N-acetyltransferase [Aurantiacibacter atlanticus]AKQ41422.1 acetyltransferase [Aurantiacibacter atlanticus]MDF1833909.1 N-acetyltransferase [Alteraurantiacibacter sp. bin_em_oilr2.035]
MILRPAFISDAESLAHLGRSSFCAAFEHLYRPQDLSVFLEEAYSASAITAEIENPEITHRLAQDDDGGPLTGFIKVRQPSGYAEHSDAANPLGLGQLYCDPARIGEGIGAALIDWALDDARQRGCDAIQLSVWSGNVAAQRFYQRYGFAKIADIDFWVGEQRDDELLYELIL